MLTNLLKYEVRATARMLLPLYAGTVLVWGVERAFSAVCDRLQLESVIPDIVQVLLLIVYWLTFLAAGLMTVFVNVRQFYRLLGEEGYFLIPLPASAAQHMGAKLLCGVGWIGAFFLFGSLMNGPPTVSTTVNTTAGEAAASYSFAGNPLSLGTERLLNAGGFGVVVLAILCEYLFIYLCIIIGGHWPRHRALASVLSYFGLLFAGQTAFLTAVVVLLNDERTGTAVVDWVMQFADKSQRVDAIVPMLWSIIAVVAAFLAVLGAVLWAVDHYYVSKRLNIA